MSRWYFSCEARDPSQPTTEMWEVGILEKKYQLLRDKGHKTKHARLAIAAEVLQDSSALYGGWSRPGTEDCFVYVGHPKRDLRDFTVETPAPPGMVFLVFVMDDGSIDDWGWREACGDDPSVPQGIVGNLIWSQQSK